jgi:hypothetical protein
MDTLSRVMNGSLAVQAALDRLRHAARARPGWAGLVAWAARHRFLVAIIAFVVASTLTLDAAIEEMGRWWALLALLAVPLAYLLRRRPRLAALAIVGGGVVLRVALAGAWQADQVAVTVAAARAALDGYNPYGHGFAAAVPPGAPFPYGPLALLVGLPGQAVETAAWLGTMLLFVLTGSWVTLGFYAADSFTVHSAFQGINDFTPGLLIAVGLLLLRTRPLLGGIVLASAAAIKPYAFAWFPAAIGFAGLPALIGLVATSGVLWSPLFVWGVDDYLKSVAMARAVHVIPNALNIPELRVLGVPVAIASLWSRRWEFVVASGAIVFVIVLFFDRWASRGYWLAITPILGIAFEAWAARHAHDFVRILRGRRLRSRVAAGAALDQPVWRGADPSPAPAPRTMFARTVTADDGEDAREAP